MGLLYDRLAAQGIGGDSMLARLSPQDASFLKALGGVGTPNPHTGLLQFFNPQEYLKLYPDVANDPYFGSNPQAHWERHGQAEGRQSGDVQAGTASHSSEALAYLKDNPDVAAAGVDPWAHYQAHGKDEGRFWGVKTGGGEPLFNPQEYLKLYSDVANDPYFSQNPQAHWEQYGQAEGRQSGGVQAGTASKYTGKQKYTTGQGAHLGQVDSNWTAPQGWDPEKYKRDNPDLQDDPWAWANPLAHYANFGYKEGRGYVPGGYAGATFRQSGGIYLANNPDVGAAKIDPWEHYQQFGKKEGRKWYGQEWGSTSHLEYTDKDFTAPEGWDPKKYLAANKDLEGNEWAQANPLAYHALFGQKENRGYEKRLAAATAPEGIAAPTAFINQLGTNYSNYINNLGNEGGNPYSPPSISPTNTLLAYSPGSFMPIDTEGGLRSAPNANRESMTPENISSIVSLGGNPGGLSSYRVYYKDGTFSDLDTGWLERGYIGKTRVESAEGPFYRYIKNDGTTVDTPLENTPSGFSRFLSNAGEAFHSAAPVLIPALGYAAMAAGAGGVVGGALGTATGATGGTAGAAGGAAGGSSGALGAAASTPWYLSQPVLQAGTTGLLSTGTNMMQGKPFGEALTQGLISGALSYVGGSIVDGMGNVVDPSTLSPAVQKAVVTGVLGAGTGKLQGQEWNEAIMSGLASGVLSYAGGKLVNSATGEPVGGPTIQETPGVLTSHGGMYLPPNEFTLGTENLEFGGSSGTPPPSFNPNLFGENIGAGLAYNSNLAMPGYNSPLNTNFWEEGPFNPNSMYNLAIQNPGTYPGFNPNLFNVSEGLTFAPPYEWVPNPFTYENNSFFGKLGEGLAYNSPLAIPGYNSPLEGTIFGNNPALIGGYPMGTGNYPSSSWSGSPSGININWTKLGGLLLSGLGNIGGTTATLPPTINIPTRPQTTTRGGGNLATQAFLADLMNSSGAGSGGYGSQSSAKSYYEWLMEQSRNKALLDLLLTNMKKNWLNYA